MPRLSEEQKKAGQIESDTLLRAGAGAGKTTTLLYALSRDLQTIPPSRLAVVTFTRAAAAALRSRLEEELYRSEQEVSGLEMLWIGTIDAIAARLLRQRSLLLGGDPEVQPGSDAEMLRISTEALALLDRDFQPLRPWIDPERDLLRILISMDEECTARGISPRAFLRSGPDRDKTLRALLALEGEGLTEKQAALVRADIALLEKGENLPGKTWKINRSSEIIDRALLFRDQYLELQTETRAFPIKEALIEIFEEWRERRRKISQQEGVWSFADILALAEDLGHEPFLDKMYLDEAQDTSPAQFRFLRSLTRGPLVCVGDPNQSIYGFRGADLDNFLLQTASMEEINLEDNYRSAPEIIETVEDLCRPLLGSNLRMRPAGEVRSGEVVALHLRSEGRVPRPEEEAEALLPILEAELKNFAPEEITILFRANRDLDLFYEILRAGGLPVAALRSGGLLLQEECLDLLAYLRWLIHREEGDLLRVLSSPFCGMTAEELLDFSGKIEEAEDRLQPTCTVASELLGKRPLSEIARYLVETHSFDLALDLLDGTGARAENIATLLRLLEETEREYDGLLYDRLLDRFRDVLREAKPSLSGVEAITLQTVHQAKGEEYDCVVLPRLGRRLPTQTRRKFFLSEDGEIGLALPGGLRDSVASDLEREYLRREHEEEKRLLYVALTRAKKKLVLLGSSREGKPLGGLLPSLPGDPPETASPKEEEERAPEEDLQVTAREPLLPPIALREVSWSDLVLWNRCSLRRRLEGELGFPETEYKRGSGLRESGLRVHAAIEALLQGGDLPDLSEEEKGMVRRAEGFIEDGARAEESFVFALGPYIIRGRIDYLLPGDTWILRDWKSGESDGWGEDYALQRKIYALAAFSSGARDVLSETVYLREERVESDSWKISDLPRLQKETGDRVKEILSRAPEPASLSPEPFCSGCPGTGYLCPVSRVVVEED